MPGNRAHVSLNATRESFASEKKANATRMRTTDDLMPDVKETRVRPILAQTDEMVTLENKLSLT